MNKNPFTKFLDWVSETKYGPTITGSVVVAPEIFKEALKEYHKHLDDKYDSEYADDWRYEQYD
jgi:hypothetical protein